MNGLVPTILYVENDPLSCEVMRALLIRALGYKDVTIFEDSAAFEERLETLPKKPDVIFLDIHMHPLDGFDMLKLIRKHDTYRSTQVVALTASVMNEEVRTLRDAGFDGVIAKPITYEVFPGVLDRILKGEQVWNVR
ncbi:MAG: response regulator [Anaerolineae bacterium]